MNTYRFPLLTHRASWLVFFGVSALAFGIMRASPALEVVGFWLWFSTMILAPLILAPQLRITERGLAIRSAGYLWRETLVPTSDVVDLVWEGYTLTLECKTRTITLGVSSSGAFPDYCVRVDRLRAEIRRAQDDTGVHGSRPM